MLRLPAFLGLSIALVAAAVQARQQALLAADLPYEALTRYAILRDGQPIGTHTLRFDRSGDERVVTGRVDVDVKLLGVTTYRLTHDSREVWRAGELQRLETRTDNNGRRYAVKAERTAQGLVVESERAAQGEGAAALFEGFRGTEVDRTTLPAGTLPTSLWNIGQVSQSTLLHTQSGRLAKTSVRPAGRETVGIASGTVEATRYIYTGDLRMNQWFDDRGRWVRSAFNAFDGSLIEYVLQE